MGHLFLARAMFPPSPAAGIGRLWRVPLRQLCSVLLKTLLKAGPCKQTHYTPARDCSLLPKCSSLGNKEKMCSLWMLKSQISLGFQRQAQEIVLSVWVEELPFGLAWACHYPQAGPPHSLLPHEAQFPVPIPPTSCGSQIPIMHKRLTSCSPTVTLFSSGQRLPTPISGVCLLLSLPSTPYIPLLPTSFNSQPKSPWRCAH